MSGLAPICVVIGCDFPATRRIGRWPVCDGHVAAAQASVKVAAKSVAVAMAPRLLRRFPGLARVASVVDTVRKERDAIARETARDHDVEEAQVIEARVIRTRAIPKEDG